MTIPQRLLVFLIVLELLAAGAAVGSRLARPVPPPADDSRLDVDSQTALRTLHADASSGSPAAWEKLGDAYLGNGFFPQAEVCYRQVLANDPKIITSRYGLALCLSRTGRTTEAIEQFRRFVQVAGAQHAEPASYQIGRCYLREENAAEAETAFHRVIRMPEGQIELARLLVRTGRASEAQPIIDGLLDKYPHALHVLEVAMQSAEQRSRAREAADARSRLDTSDYLFAMSLDVSDVENYRRRAGFSGPVGFSMPPSSQDQPASPYDQLAPQIARNQPWYQRRLLLPAAEAALESGRPEAAIQLLEQLFEHSQVTPQALIVYGDAQRALQQPVEAERAWQRSIKLRPTADAHRRLAQRYADLADEEQRRHHSARASHYAGVIACRARQFDSALEELQAAVELDSQFAKSWLYLGKTFLHRGRKGDAAAAFRHCLELTPYESDALSSVAALDESSS